MKPNLGDVIADKYRLDRVLGEGGMSTVYAAANVDTGKQVAIKWLQPELIRDEEQSQRLLREAQATSSIEHPNVVNVFDIGRHDGALFLVMELLRGEPLSELLMRGQQDPYEFIQLMMPVLRGVHAAHRVGVTHRDLKPDNIFICTDPHGEVREPKVLDFGISKLANDTLTPGQELTREGTVFGTPQYMAPEQMRDARSADARSDVYALGVIFYRAFSNEYPYDADTLTALAIRIVEGNALPIHELCPNLEPGLCDLVMRALALDPEQRFASVEALGLALELYSNGVTFVRGSLDRDSMQLMRRDSSLPPLRESSISLREPISGALPSSRQFAPPPPPPRTGSMRDNPAQPRLHDVNDDDDAELLDVSSLTSEPPEPPISGSTATASTLRRDSKLTIPPPPVPTSARPSRGLEVVLDDTYSAQHKGRSSRRHNWVLAASLIVIGLLAPAGWQQWQKSRGALSVAPTRAAQSPATGKTANVYAAQALRPESGKPPPLPIPNTPSDSLAVAASREASGAPAQEPTPAPQVAPPVGIEPPGIVTEPAPGPLGKTANVAPTGQLEKRKRRVVAAPAPAPVTTQLSEDRKVEPAANALQTERNPYLRH